MNKSTLDAQLKNFLIEKIDSISELEVLLLLFKDPHTTFSPKQILDHLRSSDMGVKQSLKKLVAKGLLQESSDGESKYFSYSKAIKPDAHSCVKELSEMYSTWKVSIIDTIYNKSTERLRNLANAFKLEREE